MNYFKKVAEVAKSAASTVDTGVKKLARRSDIHDRRKLIHNLKAEWGCFVYDHMESKLSEEKLRSSFEDLQQQIASTQAEIHQLEIKFLILNSNADSLPVKRESLKKATAHSDQKSKCSKCDNLIVEDLVECGIFRFHSHCLACTDCSHDISSYSHCLLLEGKPYCDKCGEAYMKWKFETCNKEELLRWCQDELKGFNQVNIPDFHPKTWRCGLGFAAICAVFRPDLIKWKALIDEETRCQTGLDALYKAGVTMLLLEADELRECDEQSIIMQILLIQRFFGGHQPHEEGLKQWNEHLTASVGRKLEQEKEITEQFDERAKKVEQDLHREGLLPPTDI